MFGLFKSDPAKKLEKQYYDLLEKAMHAQRSGDIRLYSELTEQAEALNTRIQSLKEGVGD